MYDFISLEKHLENLSEVLNKSSLFSSWILIKHQYIVMQETLQGSFPSYTLHEQRHIENIIQNIELIIGQERIKELSITDTWMLLACAYCYELSSIYILDNDFNYNSVTIQKRINDIFSDLCSNKLFIKRRLVSLITQIAQLHEKEFDTLMDLPYLENGEYSDLTHPRFIASIIRISDLLAFDYDNNRINETSFDKFNDKAKEHWLMHTQIKHLLIKNVSVKQGVTKGYIEGIEIKGGGAVAARQHHYRYSSLGRSQRYMSNRQRDSVLSLLPFR